MISPDSMPFWVALPAAIVCTIVYFVLEVRANRPG